MAKRDVFCAAFVCSIGSTSLPARWASESSTQGSRSTDEVGPLGTAPSLRGRMRSERRSVNDLTRVFSCSVFRVRLRRTPVPVLRDL